MGQILAHIAVPIYEKLTFKGIKQLVDNGFGFATVIATAYILTIIARNATNVMVTTDVTVVSDNCAVVIFTQKSK